MSADRYCTNPGCPGGEGCTNKYRKPGDQCSMEYVAAAMLDKFRWKGEGSPPARWSASDGTIVYRTFSDYCDD